MCTSHFNIFANFITAKILMDKVKISNKQYMIRYNDYLGLYVLYLL